MSSDEEVLGDLSAEPRQLQPYMYEPLAAAVVPDSAVTGLASDDSDGQEDRPGDSLRRNAESPSTGSWYVMLATLAMLACLCLGYTLKEVSQFCGRRAP